MDMQKEREAFEKEMLDSRYVAGNISVFWDKKTQDYDIAITELRMAWHAWQAAKAQAVPEGFVLVDKKDTEDWYLCEYEGMWWEHDGIDSSLCELDIGEVQAVEHKEYLITESNTLYATKVWDEENQDVDCWKFFESKEEAEKAAAYCKARFNDEPVEAQELAND